MKIFACIFTFLSLVDRRDVLPVFVSVGIENPWRLRQDHATDAARENRQFNVTRNAQSTR